MKYYDKDIVNFVGELVFITTVRIDYYRSSD